VFPATGDPFVINGDSGHSPVRTLLPAPPEPPPPVGSVKEPNSPGDTILVSPPPPHATRINADKIKVVFLIELKNIIGPSMEFIFLFKFMRVTED
jgi:hypothetical protein